MNPVLSLTIDMGEPELSRLQRERGLLVSWSGNNMSKISRTKRIHISTPLNTDRWAGLLCHIVFSFYFHFII